MKKLLAIFAFTFLGMLYAQAQERPTVPSELTETIIQELGLTAEQNASVNKIILAYRPAMDTIKNSTLSPADKAKKLNAFAEREKLTMKNILTDAQFIKYLELTERI